MADPISTLSTHVTAPVDYVLMKGLLSAARKKLPFFNGTLPGELQKNQGSMSVKWRRIANLSPSTTVLGEKAGDWPIARTAVTPAISDITVAIAKYGAHIKFTEELDLFNVNSKSVQLMDTLGANAGESLNLLMETAFNAAANVRYSGGQASQSSTTTAISLNDIKYTVNQLNRESAMKFTAMGTGSQNYSTSPIRPSYFGLCHVDVEEDIRGLTGFIPVEQYGGYTETYPFEFGAVSGVRWMATEIIPITSAVTGQTATGVRGTSTTIKNMYRSYIFGQEAVGSVGLGNMHAKSSYEMYDPKKPPAVELIVKAVGSAGAADPYNEVGTIAWKAFFAGKILNDAWVWKVVTCASSLA
jgi:N4-gp56 family major capsid protein